MDQYLTNLQSIWGVILFVGIPLLFLGARTIEKRREARDMGGTLPPRIMQFFFLPMAAFHLILMKIIEIPNSHISLKISETILTIVFISFMFNAINYLFFSENNILKNKNHIPKLGRDVLHTVLILIISAFVLANVWGLDLGNLLTALGVSSLVIGLALQEPLANIFNGISLLIAKPFEEGDWIKVGDDIGRVVDINWRSLEIVNRSNELIIIPNNMISKEKVKNLSRPNKLHAEMVTIGFSYDDHPEKVKQVAQKILDSTPEILKSPPPVTLTLTYEDFYINYGIKFFVKDYADSILIKDKIMTKMYSAAIEYKLTIPFPKQELDIDIKSGES